ncbi:hypothetical protein N665_0068s0013 [Sinapis alba]|nr:hypothetical protein N665_0068s0013 [Sinapis alba]
MSVMNQALRPFMGRFMVVYFDDIFIFSMSLKDHIDHLRVVLLVLLREKLFAVTKSACLVSMEYCFWAMLSMSVGWKVDTSKVEAIQNWPTPKTVSVVRSFHGLASFYQRSVSHFSSIMALVADCIKLSQFVWSLEAEKAFQLVKQKLPSAPVLDMPNFLFHLNYIRMLPRMELALF